MFKKKEVVKVPLEDMTFEKSEYQAGDYFWKAETLYDFAKAKGYPTINIPLCSLNLSVRPFTCDDLTEFIFQCKRVKDCTLDYPILLDNKGRIADGYHRLCKAIIMGKETIKAIRLLKMPAPDWDEHEK